MTRARTHSGRHRAVFFLFLAFPLLFAAEDASSQWPNPGIYAPGFDPLAVCDPPSTHAAKIFRVVWDHARRYAEIPPLEFCKNTLIPNAYALAFPTQYGIQYRIYYNPNFMGDVDVRVDNDFAIAGIFAHEIGHIEHFSQLTRQPSSPNNTKAQLDLVLPHKKELRADEFSGFVLATMGASVDDVVDVQRTVFTLHVNREYADSITRLRSMLSGYVSGSRTPPSQREIERVVSGQSNLAAQFLRWHY
jgi:hypothetical protein